MWQGRAEGSQQAANGWVLSEFQDKKRKYLIIKTNLYTCWWNISENQIDLPNSQGDQDSFFSCFF